MVEAAYLEVAAPSIGEAGKGCVELGARRVLLLPYFLSAGVHVQNDLEEQRRALQQAFPDVTFILAQPLGRHAALVDLVLQRAGEALSACVSLPARPAAID